MRGMKEETELVEGIEAEGAPRGKERSESQLGGGAGWRASAAADLTGDDEITEGAFGGVVIRRDSGVSDKDE